MPRLLQPLPDGPLAVIGDIHGELEALERLLARLGHGPGQHPTRKLVFVGDLVDRGPDSVAVVERVAELVGRGQAVAALGNHELNVLLGDHKEGNGWFFGFPDHAQLKGGGILPFASRQASDSERRSIHAFLASLPLVLERADLRVVHAHWHPEAFAQLPAEGDAAALSQAAEDATLADLEARGVREKAEKEREEFARLKRRDLEPTYHLGNVAEEDSALQARNPVKLLTSGREIPVAPGKHFFAGGKWRFVQRDAWWRGPVDKPTVVGHYWRRRGAPIFDKVDAWAAMEPFAWSGNVFCVDYSVGRRYAERAFGAKGRFNGGLGALLWPEQRVVFDDRDEEALAPLG
jgi:Calcineurin-like phosphoesterase